jgi:hypothetical protein
MRAPSGKVHVGVELDDAWKVLPGELDAPSVVEGIGLRKDEPEGREDL